MSDVSEAVLEPAGRGENAGGVPAIDRALNVLECLSQSRKGYSVSELSRRLALPKSSVHLILRTLERRGYLQKQSSGGRYKFGMQLVALSRVALEGVELRDEARPSLAALAEHTGLTAHIGVLERGEIVIVERIESSGAIRVVSWIGRRMDLNTTAVGKAVRAYLPEGGVEHEGRPGQLTREGDMAVGSDAAQRADRDRVRTLGYAVCDEDGQSGVRGVGAPVLSRQGHAVAAVGVAGTTFQIPPERLDALGRAVREAADEISARVQRGSS